MASIESSDPQKSNGKSESSVRLIPLSYEVEFDWSLFKNRNQQREPRKDSGGAKITGKKPL